MESVMDWVKFDNEMTDELMASVKNKTAFLCYQNGRYFNGWIEFDEYEGGYFWCDEDGSEPAPSHYAKLPDAPKDTE